MVPRPLRCGPVGLQALSSALIRTNPHIHISMVQTLHHARVPRLVWRVWVDRCGGGCTGVEGWVHRCGGGGCVQVWRGGCTGVEGVGAQVWRGWVYSCGGGGCTGVEKVGVQVWNGGGCTGVEGVDVQVWRRWVYRCGMGGGCTGVEGVGVLYMYMCKQCSFI